MKRDLKMAGILFWLVPVLLFACKEPPPIKGESTLPNNLLETLHPQDLKGFQWMNSPSSFALEKGALSIEAARGSDFFNNLEVTGNAPLLYREMSGDFVATLLVQPNFQDVWNAGALMVHIDSSHWIKFAFENSDATGKSIVSVVTKGSSDDANGVRLPHRDNIWLRIIKKGNLYALHWSEDGSNFKMARLCSLPETVRVKIGIEAQCPAGAAAWHKFLFFSLEEKTVDDLRTG